MVLIILQQQIYRSAKWIVNAANTIRLIMHYYIYVRLMQNKVMTYVHYEPLCPKFTRIINYSGISIQSEVFPKNS